MKSSRSLALTIALLVTLAKDVSCQTQSGASLESTVSWMRGFYAAQGGGYKDGGLSGSDWYSSENTKFETIGRCTFRISDTARLNLAGTNVLHHTQVANFGDLSPKVSVRVLNKGMVIVNAETTTGKQLVRSDQVGTMYREEVARSSTSTAIGFVFVDEERATRFARALEHLIALCGGKLPPF